MTKLATLPIYGMNPLKYLQKQKAVGLWTLYVGIEDARLTLFVRIMILS